MVQVHAQLQRLSLTMPATGQAGQEQGHELSFGLLTAPPLQMPAGHTQAQLAALLTTLLPGHVTDDQSQPHVAPL